MIIDADCHVSSREPIGSVDELIRQMDELGIDKAVCWPKFLFPNDMEADNAAIGEGARKFPDRIIPFAGINPKLGTERGLEELDRCISEYGIRGVKLNGVRDRYFIDEKALSYPVVEKLDEAGMVFAVHCGSDDFEKTHPFRIAKISDDFPTLQVLLIHFGGSARPDIHEAAIEYAQKYPQWQLVDSEADYRKILRALEILGADRISYGSDTPFCPMRYEWGLRQVIYQDLSEADKAQVFGENIEKMLSL